MDVVSLFSGAGGLDRGFEKAGFSTIWANEFDREIWSTYEANFPKTKLDRRSISDIENSEVPNCDGIIGGPPCQSWSEAGSLRGIEDKRGQLFYDFIRILEYIKPKFFLAENVSGMLAGRQANALEGIKNLFREAGYDVFFKLLNAKNYGVPQDRKRVFFIGFRTDLSVVFEFPSPIEPVLFLSDAIKDLADCAIKAQAKDRSNRDSCLISNHEYMTGGFSSIYMSRNRVRSWDEPSFTIQAGGRHAPIHPQAPKMKFVEKDKRIFEPGYEHLYRRLSVRECARIQTFPDDHKFIYDKTAAGYKMIGNAVPCELAYHVAKSIWHALIDG
jgi:DNA (cytosine-5)-methyltransferase 1